MSAEELHLPTAGPTPDEPADARPQDLRLVSVSRDGRRMLFVDPSGQEFTVEVDDRLRAAMPADSPRRSESPVTDPKPNLRPKDIQNRIRAGESVEEVAVAAGTTPEKIMAFAAPVLAEREHTSERAQNASLRRRSGEPSGSMRTLGQAVAAQLGRFHLDPAETITWDSYRRPDGKWKLSGEYTCEERSGIAEMTFDAAGNYVGLDNDDARWLVGDLPETPEPAPTVDDLSAVRQRRAQQPPAPTVPPPSEHAAPGRAVPDGISATEDTIEQPLEADTPLEAYLFDAPSSRDTTESAEPATATAEEPAEPSEQAPAPKPKRSRRKRASVPSWDEIMFGGGKSDG